MRPHPPQTFVLVTGAWHGAFVWTALASRLRAMGHTVFAPSLSGIGERRHEGALTADLSTHIQDVAAVISLENLSEVTLVGWSYGGMVIPGVQARLPDRVRRLVFLDAFFPERGKALVDYIPTEWRSRP